MFKDVLFCKCCLFFFFYSHVRIFMVEEKQEYLGDFSRRAHLSIQSLLSDNYARLDNTTFLNGLILELRRFALRKKLAPSKVYNWILNLIPSELYHSNQDYLLSKEFQKRLNSKIAYLSQCRIKLRKNKKRNEIDLLENTLFDLSFPVPDVNFSQSNIHEFGEASGTNRAVNLTINSEASDTDRTVKLTINDEVRDTDRTANFTIGDGSRTEKPTNDIVTETDEVDRTSLNSEKKKKNLHLFQIKKDINRHKKILNEQKCELANITKKIGWLKSRNIKKRKKNASVSRQKLLMCQWKIRKLERQNLQKDKLLCSLEDQIRTQKNKIVSEQKLKSKYRNLYPSCSQNNESPKIKSLKGVIKELGGDIRRIENELVVANEKNHDCEKEPQKLKSGGIFSDSVRMCVLELVSLEVATDKIGRVIQAVAKHLFDTNFSDRELPSRQVCVNMTDEAQYITERYIAELLLETPNWGVNKDGTSRRKEQILDTGITLGSGKMLSLGFTKIASEDSDTIVRVLKDKMQELSDAHSHGSESKDNFLKDVMTKLSFLMSDRASNEKASNRKLCEWRDTLLESATSESHDQIVHHFFCMAHCLLGFHTYSRQGLQIQQSELEPEGKLGRDASGQFFKFGKTVAAERVVRMVAETFGPAGDHLGLRDLWIEVCKDKGIKSHIGNYRDNRFNALFSTAAQIIHHYKDLTQLLEVKVKGGKEKPNQKLVSIHLDLCCPRLMTLVQALAVMYIKVTGPYHALIVSNKVPYLGLCGPLQQLFDVLKECQQDPQPLTSLENNVCSEYMDMVHHELHPAVFTLLFPEEKQLFLQTLKLLCKAFVKTFENQLADFVSGGKYSCAPSEIEMGRTSFSRLDNLSCERHLGSLDASQRRRPNASFHYHSSIEMLKQNGKDLVKWILSKPVHEQKQLWIQARRNGILLRNKHRTAQKQEERKKFESFEDMTRRTKERAAKKLVKHAKKTALKTNDKKQRKCQKRKLSEQSNVEETSCKIFKAVDVQVGNFVAVAFSDPDAWYIGTVLNVNNTDELNVKFLHPSKGNPCVFKWPTGSDNRLIDPKYIIHENVPVVPDASLRFWKLDKQMYIKIDRSFLAYAKKHFK